MINFDFFDLITLESFMVLLRSESPSGICAKLRTVAASNNRDNAPQSLFAYASHFVQSYTSLYRQRLPGAVTLLLLVRATFIWVLFFAHIPFVVNHTFNANGEVATVSL